jgi:glycosyltransferase involved in cell wall biosynthesis
MRRVLIDALGAASPGAVRHLEGFLPALDAVSNGNRFELYLRRSIAQRLALCSSKNLVVHTLPDFVCAPMPLRLLLDLVVVPLIARVQRVDLVVTLANFGPIWTASPHAVFQRNAMYYSPEYLDRVGGLEWVAATLRQRFTVAAMRRASLVITPSRAMAQLIRQRCEQVAQVPFEALHHGVDLNEFVDNTDRSSRRPSGPFTFLYPTKPEIYKGLEILLDATRILRKWCPSFRILVTAREDGWPQETATAIESARQRGDLEWLQFVGSKSPSEMGDLYRSVDAMIYPSLCESFGFPLVEAMATGTPIVAADLDVNREICGDAALYYKARDPHSCAQTMKELLDRSQLSGQLVRRARERLAERDWTWAANALRFQELCGIAIANHRS